MPVILSRLGLPRPLLRLKEEMSGWIQLDQGREAFRLSLEAIGDSLLPLNEAMPFAGFVRMGHPSRRYPVEGSLTINLSGPHYDFVIHRPDLPALRCCGHKTYRLPNLHASLTTCPLQVTSAGRIVGGAELVYREPLWRFPLTAISLGWRQQEET